MKKLVLTTLLTCAVAASVLAQGSVNLALQTTRLARYTTDGTTLTAIPIGSPASVGTYGALNIAAYYATQGTASAFTATAASLVGSAWTESTTVLHAITSNPGWTPSTTFTLQNAAGSSTVQLMILGWTGTYLDWDSAYTAGHADGSVLFGWTGSTLSTGAVSWQNGTGAPLASPPVNAVAVTAGATGYNGLVLQSLAPVPEPGTFALAGLGLATLLIFRRRK